MSPGTPPGRLKSQKTDRERLGDPPGGGSRRDREKRTIRTPPGNRPCGSRTVTAMVFTRSTDGHRATFWVALGLLLAPSLTPRGPPWRPGGEKRRPQKHAQKDLVTGRRRCSKWSPNGTTKATLFGARLPSGSGVSVPGPCIKSDFFLLWAGRGVIFFKICVDFLSFLPRYWFDFEYDLFVILFSCSCIYCPSLSL